MQQVKGENLHPETAPFLRFFLPLPRGSPRALHCLLLLGQAWCSAGGPFWPHGAQGRSPGRAKDAEAKSSPAAPSGSTDLSAQRPPSVPRPPVGSWGISGPRVSLHPDDQAERRVWGCEPHPMMELPPGCTRSCWVWCPPSGGMAWLACVIRTWLAARAGSDVILGCGVLHPSDKELGPGL